MCTENKVYWNKTGETFAGRGFGSDITEYFFNEEGKCIDVKRLKKLAEEGKISPEKPDTPEKAEEKELNQLRDSVKSKNVEIADLTDKLASVPKNLTKAKEEIKKLKSEVSILSLENAELKEKVETLESKPKTGSGKNGK